MDTLLFVVIILLVTALAIFGFRAYFKPAIDPHALPTSYPLNEDDDLATFEFTWPEKEKYFELKEAKEPDQMAIKKALLERAMAALDKLWKVEREGYRMHNAHRAGILPEKVWESFQRATREVNIEMEDIKFEADSAAENNEHDLSTPTDPEAPPPSALLFSQAAGILKFIKQKKMEERKKQEEEARAKRHAERKDREGKGEPDGDKDKNREHSTMHHRHSTRSSGSSSSSRSSGSSSSSSRSSGSSSSRSSGSSSRSSGSSGSSSRSSGSSGSSSRSGGGSSSRSSGSSSSSSSSSSASSSSASSSSASSSSASSNVNGGSTIDADSSSSSMPEKPDPTADLSVEEKQKLADKAFKELLKEEEKNKKQKPRPKSNKAKSKAQ